MQSNVIFGFIAVAYLFFITARGELSVYLTILRGGGKQQNNQADNATNNGQQNIFNGIPLLDPGQINNGDGTASNSGAQSLSEPFSVDGIISNPSVLGLH
jgi:hypothetical protein